VMIMGANRHATVKTGAKIGMLVACGAGISIQIENGAAVDTVIMHGDGDRLWGDGVVREVYQPVWDDVTRTVTYKRR